MIFKAILSDNVRKDGTRNVLLYIYDPEQGRKDRIKTKYYVKPENWSNGKAKGANSDLINAGVQTQLLELQRTWLKNTELKGKDLKANKGNISFRWFIDDYVAGVVSGKILNEGKPYSPATIKGLKNYTRLLKEYLGKKSWSDINQSFYDGYVTWMTEKGFMNNTIARAVKCLKNLMKRGAKYHNNMEYLNFKASYQDSDSIALTDSEIERIMKCELPDHLEAERDRFYLSYNLLLRFGDSIKIDKRDIIKKKDKFLLPITHEKTGNKAIIPLFPKSIEILKKYGYSLPNTTNQESNWKLKEIGRLAGVDEMITLEFVKGGKKIKDRKPKHELITTHTARRSMATNLLLAGFDLKQIQLMGGWRSMAILEKYLKIDKLQNALTASEHKFFN